MRNNIIFSLLFIAFTFTACKKDSPVEYLFDQSPEERMTERNNELRAKLLESTNGWKAFVRTSARGGGYGFYMKFTPDEKVSMYSDWDDQSAATVKTSTYALRFIMNTTLFFDTYNYISIMQDPQVSVNGGTRGEGLQSDIEFEYIRSTEDTIVLRGKKYRNNLYLLKATSSEASGYTSGNYAASIDNFKNYFLTHSNNYIAIEQGGNVVKAGIVFDNNNKTVEINGKVSEGNFDGDKQGFGFSIDGAFFVNSLEMLGIEFVAAKLKDANTMVFIDSNGKEYPVIQNPVPLIELPEVFGPALNKTYNSIYFVDDELPPGVASDFNSVYNAMSTRFKGTNRTIDTLEFRLMNSTTGTVRLWYWSGTSHFLADASFEYTLTPEGELTMTNFTINTSNGNWGTRATQIGNFADWLQDGPFKIDWVASSIPGSPNFGGLYKKSNEDDFLYGYLRRF